MIQFFFEIYFLIITNYIRYRGELGNIKFFLKFIYSKLFKWVFLEIFRDIRIRTFFKIKNADTDADLNFSVDNPRMRIWRTSLIYMYIMYQVSASPLPPPGVFEGVYSEF